MRFSVINLGCKVNRVESDAFGVQLRSQGHAFDEPDASTHLVIVNTCTVTGEAEKKTRKAVRQALRRAPQAHVIVTGCAAAISPQAFADMDERVEVVPKGAMEARLAAYGPAQLAEAPSCDLFASRTRRGVKVQDGCDNACTYCIVHVARGRAVSRPALDVLEDVRALCDQGVREIVLSGINIGSYCHEGTSLAGLLRLLLEHTPAWHEDGAPGVRFRISSIEPMDLDDDCVEVMAQAGPRVCAHLHLPLQAGSSKVLREMGRPYDAEDFRALMEGLRLRIPHIALSTDVIVGFPGETDEDFQDTLALVRACAFSKVHVFPYSKREGTPAAARADQVPAPVKAARAAALRQLSDELRTRDLAARQGTEEYVLVEGDGVGMTESYHEIPVDAHLPQGALVRLSL